MPSPVIGSSIFGELYSTQEMRDIFSDRNMVQMFLDVEAAIARVQGSLGIIPEKAALEIVEKCRVETIDMAKLGARTGVVGFPIVGLVEQLVAACSDGWGEYAHWGTTTQDIMDTADVLQFQDALKVLERDLDAVADQLVGIAKAHRDTVMVGRTHIQHALPVTFGYKAAVWLSSIDRHRKRLIELRPRLLVGQFSGAVGTLASLGDRGLEMQDALMDELGLGRPDITWHSARDSIAEVTGFLALVTGTLGKIGLDIILMSVTEVDEVKEPFVPGRGSSSTMPQKRNPVMSEMLVAIAKNVRQLHGTILDAMLNDHERGGAGPWQTEWPALPDAFILTGAALKHALELLGGLEVGRQRMRDNLGSTSGMISAEAVMMKLAPMMGRQRAHDVVYDCCREAERECISFLDALSKNSEIAGVAERDALAAMVDPTNYLGTATRMIDRLLMARAEKRVLPLNPLGSI
jgi:3-carboxy-cis,cis-muconate cycloisomerase